MGGFVGAEASGINTGCLMSLTLLIFVAICHNLYSSSSKLINVRGWRAEQASRIGAGSDSIDMALMLSLQPDHSGFRKSCQAYLPEYEEAYI